MVVRYGNNYNNNCYSKAPNCQRIQELRTALWQSLKSRNLTWLRLRICQLSVPQSWVDIYSDSFTQLHTCKLRKYSVFSQPSKQRGYCWPRGISPKHSLAPTEVHSPNLKVQLASNGDGNRKAHPRDRWWITMGYQRVITMGWQRCAGEKHYKISMLLRCARRVYAWNQICCCKHSLEEADCIEPVMDGKALVRIIYLHVWLSHHALCWLKFFAIYAVCPALL